MNKRNACKRAVYRGSVPAGSGTEALATLIPASGWHMPEAAGQKASTYRTIGLLTATSLVVGSMIGTGVFLKPAIMASQAGSSAFVLTAWLIAGLLSLAGALTYAELTSRLPAAGGEYAIIKSAYGNFPAYLYGWMRFTIGAPGSAASYAVGAAAFFHVIYPYTMHGIKTAHIAIVFLGFFTLINTLTILVSASVQVMLTTIKVLSLAAIFIVLVFLTPAQTSQAASPGWPGMVSFSAALMAALWAYDGWNNLPMMGAEVKNARRNLPLALVIGMVLVILVYLAVNYSFFRVLPFDKVSTLSAPGSPPVATAAIALSISDASVKVIAALLVISALGALNGSLLASPRVPFAMARDGMFFHPLSFLSRKHQLPVVSTIAEGVIAMLLALSGTFDQLTDSVVFASWLFYGLTAAAIFRLRGKLQHLGGIPEFRVPLYPVLPIAFLLCASAFLIYSVIALPYLTALGLGIIALGIPLYFVFCRGKKSGAGITPAPHE